MKQHVGVKPGTVEDDLATAIGRAAILGEAMSSTCPDATGFQELVTASTDAERQVFRTPVRTLDGLLWKLSRIAREMRDHTLPAILIFEIEACIDDAARLARPSV